MTIVCFGIGNILVKIKLTLGQHQKLLHPSCSPVDLWKRQSLVTWKYRFLIWKNSQLQQLFCCPSCVTTSESHHFEFRILQGGCRNHFVGVPGDASLRMGEDLKLRWLRWIIFTSYYGDWVHCEFFMILDFYGKPAKFRGFPFRNVFEWLNDSYGPSTQTFGIGEVGGSFHDPRWWGLFSR